jgi:hypothetical protein
MLFILIHSYRDEILPRNHREQKLMSFRLLPFGYGDLVTAKVLAQSAPHAICASLRQHVC